MISPYRFSLILLGAVLFLGSPVVAQTSQTPASLSGKTDKKGWPLPRWWVKYRKRFGMLPAISSLVVMPGSRDCI